MSMVLSVLDDCESKGTFFVQGCVLRNVLLISWAAVLAGARDGNTATTRGFQPEGSVGDRRFIGLG
jgi:hypothetical protein